mgnify:CR=1 FL=1
MFGDDLPDVGPHFDRCTDLERSYLVLGIDHEQRGDRVAQEVPVLLPIGADGNAQLALVDQEPHRRDRPRHHACKASKSCTRCKDERKGELHIDTEC